MKPHGQDTQAVCSTPDQDQRRFTLSVIVADGPAMAARLVGWLEWRGFDFDRVVVKPDGEDREITRIVLTLTTSLARVRTLMDTIGRYAPVQALRQFYAAPVIAPDWNTPTPAVAARKVAHGAERALRVAR